MAIKFSVRFAMSLLLLHVMTTVVVFMTAMPLEAKLAMSLLISLSLIYYLVRDIFFLFPDSWREISLDQDGVAIITRDGSKLLGKCANETTVSSYFVVLRVKMEDRHLAVSRVIFPDALGAGAFREFCVRLKFA